MRGVETLHWCGALLLGLAAAGLGDLLAAQARHEYAAAQERTWRDGHEAGRLGLSAEACPHPEGAADGGGCQARRDAWLDGWQQGFLEHELRQGVR